MNEKVYSYPQKFLFNRMPVIMMYAIIVFLLPTAILNTIDILTGQYFFDMGGILDLLIVYLSPFAFTILFSIDLNMLPSISLGKDGINVKIFNFRWHWIHISWNQISSIELLANTYRRQRIWCISTNLELTIWHKVLSRKYCGQASSKKLYLTGLLENSDDLVNDIKYFITFDQLER